MDTPEASNAKAKNEKEISINQIEAAALAMLMWDIAMDPSTDSCERGVDFFITLPSWTQVLDYQHGQPTVNQLMDLSVIWKQ